LELRPVSGEGEVLAQVEAILSSHERMRVFPASRQQWFGLLLFPFKAYLPVGIICLLVWKAATEGHRVRGDLAAATAPVMLGYMICALVFLVLAVIRFFTHRRELVAEALLLAGVGFTIALFLARWCAVS
jgi:hypothetical protein